MTLVSTIVALFLIDALCSQLAAGERHIDAGGLLFEHQPQSTQEGDEGLTSVIGSHIAIGKNSDMMRAQLLHDGVMAREGMITPKVHKAMMNATIFLEGALSAARARAWRIMPLGDSLTDGYSFAGGYRCPLSALLRDAGVQHEFVGFFKSGGCGTHAGFSDHTIKEIDAKVSNDMLGQLKPDIVVLQAGTNDLFYAAVGSHRGASPSGAKARVVQLLDKLYTARPNLIVALSTVTEINVKLCSSCPADLPKRIASFNAMLPEIAAMQQRDFRRVVLHDVNAKGWTLTDYPHNDGVHFNAQGYQKIADIRYQALMPLLRCGVNDAHTPGFGHPEDLVGGVWALRKSTFNLKGSDMKGACAWQCAQNSECKEYQISFAEHYLGANCFLYKTTPVSQDYKTFRTYTCRVKGHW